MYLSCFLVELGRRHKISVKIEVIAVSQVLMRDSGMTVAADFDGSEADIR